MENKPRTIRVLLLHLGVLLLPERRKSAGPSVAPARVSYCVWLGFPCTRAWPTNESTVPGGCRPITNVACPEPASMPAPPCCVDSSARYGCGLSHLLELALPFRKNADAIFNGGGALLALSAHCVMINEGFSLANAVGDKASSAYCPPDDWNDYGGSSGDLQVNPAGTSQSDTNTSKTLQSSILYPAHLFSA